MTEISSNHLELFAKLSKILAETFSDIHKICLKESVYTSTGPKISQAKQNWLDKREESKQRDDFNQGSDSRLQGEEEDSKPPKQKKFKSKPHEGLQNGNKEKKHQKKKKIAKWEQQGRPRPPLNVFMLFLRDSKMEIMEAKPELTPSQVSTYASALWNELTEEQKQKYKSEYRENRIKYDEQLKLFQKDKIMGKTLPRPKKIEKNNNHHQDILDKQIPNMDDSDNSGSMSGI